MEVLSKTTFLEKVFDYDSEQTWSFKGPRPAIIDFYAGFMPRESFDRAIDELFNIKSEIK
jgi:thioredoxin 1